MFAKYASLSPKQQRLVRVLGITVFAILIIATCISVIKRQHQADLQKIESWIGDTKVAMYTTSSCTYCQAARLYFAENGIEYREFNMDHSDEHFKQFVELGGSGTPLLYVNKKRMDGFNSGQFEQLYAP